MNIDDNFLDDILKEFGTQSNTLKPNDDDIASILEEFNITALEKKEPDLNTEMAKDIKEPDLDVETPKEINEVPRKDDFFETIFGGDFEKVTPTDDVVSKKVPFTLPEMQEDVIKDEIFETEFAKQTSEKTEEDFFTDAKIGQNKTSNAFDNIIDELSKITLASDTIPLTPNIEEIQKEGFSGLKDFIKEEVFAISEEKTGFIEETPLIVDEKTAIVEETTTIDEIINETANEQQNTPIIMEGETASEQQNIPIIIEDDFPIETKPIAQKITFDDLSEMPESLHIKNTTETRLDAFFDGYDNSDLAKISINETAFSNVEEPSEFTDSFSSYRDFASSMTSGNIFSGLLGKLLNEKEDSEEPIPEYVGHKMPEIDDFTSYEDTETVRSDLQHLKQSAMFRGLFATVFTALLFYLNIGVLSPNILPDFIKPSISFFGFGATSVILLLGLVCTGAGTFFESIMKLFSLRPTGDSLASVAVIFSIFQGIYIATSAQTNNATPLVVSAIAALAFTFSIYIKLMQINTVINGFNIISDKKEKHTLIDVSSNELPVELKDNEKDLAIVAKTAFVENYLENSFCPNPSYKINRVLTLVALVGMLITGIVGFIFQPIVGASAFYNALVAICSAACISACFLNSATFILPSFIQNLKSSLKGGVVVGYDSVIKAKEVLGIITKDNQLLSSKESRIGGMKMLAGSEIYDIVTKLASIYNTIGGTLSGTFLKILDNKKSLLQEVTSVDITEGEGIRAVISGLNIFVGTTKYLMSNGIIMPSTDFEEKFAKDTKKVIQVGFDGELRAIFVAEYKAGDTEYECIDIIDSLGLTVIAYSEDFNVSAEEIKRALEAPNTDILEYGASTASQFKELLSEKQYTKASINSNTGLIGIVHAIKAARGISRSFKILSIIKCINVVLGLVLCAIMFYSGSPLQFMQLLTYQSIWTILGIALSLF